MTDLQWHLIGKVTAICFVGSRVVKLKVNSTGSLGVSLKGLGLGSLLVWYRILVIWGRRFSCMELEAVECCYLGFANYSLATCLPLDRWL